MKKLFLTSVMLLSTMSIMPMATLTKNTVKTSQKLASSVVARDSSTLETALGFALMVPLVMDAATIYKNSQATKKEKKHLVSIDSHIKNPLDSVKKSLQWELAAPLAFIFGIGITNPLSAHELSQIVSSTHFYTSGAATAYAWEAFQHAKIKSAHIDAKIVEAELFKNNPTTSTDRKFNFMKDDVK